MLLLVLLDSSWYHTVISSVLVGILLISLIFLSHFFVVNCFSEGRDFYLRVHHFVEEKLENKTFQTYLEQYHITSDVVKNQITANQAQIEDWLQQKGVNVTKITEVISQMNSTDSAINRITNAPATLTSRIYDFYTWYLNMDLNILSIAANFFFGTGITLFTVINLIWASFRNFVLSFAVYLATIFYLLSSEEFFLDKFVRY